VDDDWLWGGSADQIHQTIVGGRKGYMPAYGTTLNPEQTDEVANYVLSLSGIEHNAEAAAKGQKIFNGYAGGCYQCHTTAGKGLYSQGSANLTDQIWTVADTKGDESPEERLKLVKNVIANGIQRQMPVFGTKLSETEVKVLVAYLKQMSGTQQQ
jgi:cytochrome c oxidase cbb3-type subunit 3